MTVRGEKQAEKGISNECPRHEMEGWSTKRHEEAARPLEFYRTDYTIQFLMWVAGNVRCVLVGVVGGRGTDTATGEADARPSHVSSLR